MLSMQDEDGGVWHKQTSEQFCGFIMPEKDTLVSYVIGTGQEPFKSSCATGDFAAVMAIAARVYKPFEPAYAAECLRAARKACAWLEKHPNVTFRNPAGRVDRRIRRRQLRRRAAVGRRRTVAHHRRGATTDRISWTHYARRSAQRHRGPNATDPQGWANVANLALWTYVLGGGEGCRRGGRHPPTIPSKAADEIVRAHAPANGYRISMTTRDYIWGSNGVAANYGMQLLVANAFRPNPRYVETPSKTCTTCWGGTRSRCRSSRRWATTRSAIRTTGPAARTESRAVAGPALRRSQPRAPGSGHARRRSCPRACPRRRCTWTTRRPTRANEVAINWNAPLVFLLAGALAGK